MEAKLDVLLGRVIKIKTMMNEQVEGTIYTLDKVTNCLVLDCSSENSKHNSFRIFKISHIKEVLHVKERQEYANVGYVHLDVLKSRESNTLKGLSDQVSKLGVGVTKEAQDIFNALSKT